MIPETTYVRPAAATGVFARQPERFGSNSNFCCRNTSTNRKFSRILNHMLNIGMTIVTLRKRLGLSQEDLAAQADLSRHYIYKLEKDKASPTMNTIIKIATILHIKPSDFIALSETAETEQTG